MRSSGEGFLSRAFRVLHLLAGAHGPLSLHRVSEQLALPKPTALRLLRSLCDLGYVQAGESPPGYRLTAKVYTLIPVDGDGWLKERTLPEMNRLKEAVNETVNLACIEDGKVRYIQILESTQSLRCIPDDRLHDEVLRTALGRAMVAFWPEPKIEDSLPGLCKSAGYRSIPEMREELAATRRRGWAVESEQGCRGVDCLAAPLLDSEGFPYAAISLSVPTARLTATYRSRLGRELKVSVGALCGDAVQPV